ncbi:30S ribosomal protein S11 [Candidatus Dojkabacteria bacterium]|uniref:Small ribosomal subunit protein uS11 n=1 Tax=Candidatus Dojkabacteria bacterium TaxID=2099670 RepID=A0A955L940_9BACT|nr:30S ribosomal protein S11 [Candidatus Dojkabacteria bacterium]
MAKKAAKSTKPKKKAKKSVPKAIVHVNCSYNNTIVGATDLQGNTLATVSPGAVGFKGSRKSSAYAATKAAEVLMEQLKQYGVNEATVKVRGIGMGRQAAVKGLRAAGLKIRTLMDVTPIPHGGCSPRKKPRGS